MGRKRVAAAELFRQQNVAQMADNAESEEGEDNFYLQEQSVEDEMQANVLHRAVGGYGGAASMPAPTGAVRPRKERRTAPAPPPMSGLPTSEELQMEKEPIRVRET